jgi:hypothetical protein
MSVAHPPPAGSTRLSNYIPPAGLTRGSTSSLPEANQDVGARIKSGHGDAREWRELMGVLGRETG